MRSDNALRILISSELRGEVEVLAEGMMPSRMATRERQEERTSHKFGRLRDRRSIDICVR